MRLWVGLLGKRKREEQAANTDDDAHQTKRRGTFEIDLSIVIYRDLSIVIYRDLSIVIYRDLSIVICTTISAHLPLFCNLTSFVWNTAVDGTPSSLASTSAVPSSGQEQSPNNEPQRSSLASMVFGVVSQTARGLARRVVDLVWSSSPEVAAIPSGTYLVHFSRHYRR